jgi:xylulokinase
MDAAGATLVKSFPDNRLEAISLLSSQLLNYRSRSSAILDDGQLPSNPSTPAITSSIPRLKRVYATGGASANHTILSLMADVLSANVCKNVEYSTDAGWVDAKWNACSVGVAYKARWGWERIQGRKDIGFDEIVKECREKRGATRGKDGKGMELEEEGIRVVASPGEGSRAYERSVEWWRALEDRALEKDDDEE